MKDSTIANSEREVEVSIEMPDCLECNKDDNKKNHNLKNFLEQK